MSTSPTEPVEPFDPMCKRFAKDMHWLDFFKEEDQTRADYIRQEEGTFNSENGHFLCDNCYTTAGMPSSPTGWICP